MKYIRGQYGLEVSLFLCFLVLIGLGTYLKKEFLPPLKLTKNGIDLGEMNLLLLKKIEEMTLHQIEMAEKLEELQIKVESLEKDQ